jgi:hypothetical protein
VRDIDIILDVAAGILIAASAIGAIRVGWRLVVFDNGRMQDAAPFLWGVALLILGLGAAALIIARPWLSAP